MEEGKKGEKLKPCLRTGIWWYLDKNGDDDSSWTNKKSVLKCYIEKRVQNNNVPACMIINYSGEDDKCQIQLLFGFYILSFCVQRQWFYVKSTWFYYLYSFVSIVHPNYTWSQSIL